MCFESPYIGLKGSCNDASNSGLFINDLPGISLRALSAIANEEQIKGENLFRIKESNAIRTVKRDFLNLVQKKYSFEDILSEMSVFGNYGEYQEAECIELEITNCKRLEVSIDLNYLSFFSDAKFDSELVIIEDSIETKREKVRIEIGENVFRNKILSNAGVISIKINTGTHNFRQIDNCTCECSEFCEDCVTVKYFKTSGEDREELTTWKPFNFKILCRNNYDELFCMYERDLAQAVLFQTGIQLMEELMVTKEINPIVTNSKEDAETLLLLWNGSDTSQFATVSGADKIYRMDGEYYKSLLGVVLKAKNYLEKSNLKIKAHEPYLIASI